MKKQYFIFLTIACLLAISNIKAQNTPIDDFLKKYNSREGVTNVSMSQQMLASIFTPADDSKAKPAKTKPAAPAPASASTGINGVKLEKSSDGNFVWFSSSQNLNVPEAYSSVSISKTDIPENMFNDFKKTLISSKYEQFMEVNKENSNILGYYLKKVKENTNEIVVLRQQKDQFSAIYIKGDIEINQVDRYLVKIRTALARLGTINQKDMFRTDLQFALAMPALDHLKIDLPDFDHQAFKLQMEESMKGVKEQMKNLEFIYNEDMQQNIQDVIEKAQEQAKDAQQKALEDVQEELDDVEEE